MTNITRRVFIKSAVVSSAVSGNLTEVNGRPTTKTYQDQIETDVLVVGAGAAGIPAAIAASRKGARVLLLEEDQVIGGAPVDMSVGFLCGWPRVGIFREMVDVLQSNHHLLGRPVKPEEEKKDIWFTPSAYIQVLNKLVNNEKNISVICGAKAFEPLVEDSGNRNKFKGVIASSDGNRNILIKAKITIDATGNGAISEMAGCQALYGREAKSDYDEPHAQEKRDNIVMPCTMMYISQKFGQSSNPNVYGILRSKKCIDPGYTWFRLDKEGFIERNTGIYLHWGGTVKCKDTRDDMELAKAQTQAMEKIMPDLEKLYASGYETHLAQRIGVRESRRIMGDFLITENYLKKGDFEDDTVCYGQYYLDVWGEELPRGEKGLPKFGIPYRSLIPKDIEGLYVAGKIISGTHISMSAYRVQPIVSQMGQAAGTAAALAVKNDTNTRNVPIDKLKKILKEDGLL